MSVYCSRCGRELPDNTKFCPYCGAQINARAERQTPRQPQQPYQQPPQFRQPYSAAGKPVGFSEKINDPALQRLAKKQKSAKLSMIFAILPVIGFAIYGAVSDKMEFTTALLIGIAVGAVFFIIGLFGALKRRKPGWDGAVIDKKITRRSELNRDTKRYEYYNEFVIVFRTDSGKQEKHVTSDRGGGARSRLFFDYLRIGDRVRYHPAFGYYEKYDKSHDNHILCVSCLTDNPIENDVCQKCGMPLLK